MRKNTFPGKFIVIEGIDGAGKSTQVGMIAGYFSKKGAAVHMTSEPTQLPIGELIRRQLMGEWNSSPESLQLLFAADRADHLEKEILPNLKKGVNVFCDRYFVSSLAYGAVDCPLGWLVEVNKIFLMPDLAIFLDIDAKTGADAATSAKLLELYPKAGKTDRLAILGALGASASAESAGLIAGAAKDGDADIRVGALRAGVRVHPSAKASLPALMDALHDSQVSVRRTAAELIGQLGDKETDKVVPALSTLVALLASNEDRSFVLDALRAARVRDPAALEQALAIPSAEARAWACERIAKLGSKGRPFAEKLKPLLADGNDYVRRAARKALDQIAR